MAALATIALAGGCGGSSASTSAGGRAANARPQTQFASFAAAVNLRPADVEGFLAQPKKRSRQSKAAFAGRLARCAGIAKPLKPLFKQSSPSFARRGRLQLQEVSSSVEVSPSLAVATGELAAVKRALASATARRCLATAFAAIAGVQRTAAVKGVRITTHIGRMVLTPLAPGAVVAGTDGGVGMSIGAGVEYTFVAGARTLRIPTSLRVDVLGFDVGRSGVSLLTLSLGTPVPARLEARLLSTLVARARSARRAYPAVSS